MVLETKHLRINFEVLDPYLGCLVLETLHLRIIFEALDPDLGCLVLETHFPRKCSQNIDLLTVREPPGIQKQMKRMNRMKQMKAKWYTAGSSDPRFLTRLRSG